MMLTKLAQKTDWSGSGGLGHAHGLGLVLDRGLVRHESAIVLAAGRAVEKVPTQHISYLALDLM